MEIQQRILNFITRTNWVLLVVTSVAGWLWTTPGFALGIFSGGILVTANFHLLDRTLKKALKPPHPASPNVILVKYYIRFLVTGVIIFFLIKGRVVEPVGLFIGLSVVVASMMLAAMVEIKRLIFKEAV